MLTIAIIFIDLYIVNKFTVTDTFKYREYRELVEKYDAEQPTSPYPIHETDAINNYILSLHLNFLNRIYYTEKKRYEAKILGLIVYGLLFVIFLQGL